MIAQTFDGRPNGEIVSDVVNLKPTIWANPDCDLLTCSRECR
jgi:hypothetical protein